MSKRASLFLVALLLAGLVGLWRYRVHRSALLREGDWGAVSTDYVADAMRSMTEAGKAAWNPVPFCLRLQKNGETVENPACEPLYKNEQNALSRCGVQNFVGGDWYPEIVHSDPARVGAGLATAMKRRGCRTLVIDIESLRAEDRNVFTQWSAALAAELRRSIPELITSIAVHGKSNDKGAWHGAEAQDWYTLCRDHDELLIMAYDFHYPGVTKPGETAPLDWVEGILRYGVSVCSRSKLRLGLAAYGYAWPTRKVLTERGAAARPGAIIETEAKRNEKRALAHRFGVSHFFLWALGMEAPVTER